MGETGCGKTSLIRYLAFAAGVDTFHQVDIHGGFLAKDIEETMFAWIKEAKEKEPQNKQIWVFYFFFLIYFCVLFLKFQTIKNKKIDILG